MTSRVQKWGNSLAVRIPKSYALNLGWSENSPIEIAPEDDSLVIKTDKERVFDFVELLEGVTDDNVHAAWETEPAGALAEDGDEGERRGEDG